MHLVWSVVALCAAGAAAASDCPIKYCIGTRVLTDTTCGCENQGGPLWGIAIAVILICLVLDVAFWRSLKRKKMVYYNPAVEQTGYVGYHPSTTASPATPAALPIVVRCKSCRAFHTNAEEFCPNCHFKNSQTESSM
eukprot:m.84779 g.84779  ORF g.84779 m.84779 type:complete len:137 (+) comp50851_c0_seq1:90-500(+)